MIEVSVEGRPAPKGSRIQRRRASDGKTWTYPASSHEKPWIKAVKAATQVVMRHHTIIEPPYAIELVFYMPKPRRPSYEWPSIGDLDKLVRSTIDGLVLGGAMRDDRHVTHLTAQKRHADARAPGVVATIAQVSSVQSDDEVPA